MAYLHPVDAWISQAESHLTDQLERASSKGSRRSSKTSSRLSARERERVRLAGLKAERSMLKQKQALRATEEDLELELEIVKAEVRGKALEELDREHNPPLPCGSSPPSDVASFSPIVIPSVAASLPNEVTLKPEVFVPTTQTPATTETQAKFALQGPRISAATDSIVKTSPSNPETAEFIPTTFADGTSSTPYTGHGSKNSKEIAHGISEIQSPQLVERTFQSVIELQQRQNETIIATHQQLTAAMTLPQPTITKFKRDPIEYNTFIMAFDVRIHSKATSNADLLYYPNQHLEGEPADLIQGCLHMNNNNNNNNNNTFIRFVLNYIHMHK